MAFYHFWSEMGLMRAWENCCFWNLMGSVLLFLFVCLLSQPPHLFPLCFLSHLLSWSAVFYDFRLSCHINTFLKSEVSSLVASTLIVNCLIEQLQVYLWAVHCEGLHSCYFLQEHTGLLWNYQLINLAAALFDWILLVCRLHSFWAQKNLLNVSLTVLYSCRCASNKGCPLNTSSASSPMQ